MKSKLKCISIVMIGVVFIGVQAFVVDDVMAESDEEVATTAIAEQLDAINADRESVVIALAEFWAAESGYPVEQFDQTFGAATPIQLLEIGEAAHLEEVNNILGLGICDPDKDYVFTPVTPCRIVDTRKAGGALAPGESREFYVYGGVEAQGGAANCPSPRGEPRAVHINVTAVPVSGQGNVVAFPANESPPLAALINYKTGVQNIANAATIKTYFSVGAKEIEIHNRVGTPHIVIDVMGYYHELQN